MIETIDFAGDENIGVYTRVFEDLAVVPLDAPEEYISVVEKRLGVEVINTTIQGSSIIGSLLVGNSNGFIVSSLVTSSEAAVLKEHGNVMFLGAPMNAAGNVILANDELAIVHPGITERIADKISAFLDVPVLMSTIGNIPTVGMAGVATNNGLLLNPGLTKHEIRDIEEITDLPVGTGTINMGNGLIGTGLVANTTGFLVGMSTSGFELSRIDEVFGY